MATDKKSYEYLAYVTLREAWAEVKSTLIVWLVFSGVSIGIGLAFSSGVEVSKPIWENIPRPILYFIGFVIFTWFMRGEELTISIPKQYSWWMVFVCVAGLFFYAPFLLPWWCLVPINFGLIFGFMVFDNLVRIGKENFEKLVSASVQHA
jgi:hypothetical protein